jgi:hypothetical protein
MKRLLGQTFAVVVVGVLATAFAPACADNDQTIFIQNALAPPQNRANGACIYTGDPTQTFQPEGLVDLAITDTYEAALLVGNQMISRADANSARVEPNRVHVNGAVVRVTDPNGGQLGTFTALTSALINPQQNNQPSYVSTFVTALDSKTSATLATNIPLCYGRGCATTLVLANMKVFGRTLGGVDVETAEWQFPIHVCKGCLIDFTGHDDPAVPGVDCSLVAATGTSTTTTQAPCREGQDESTPCTLCFNRALPAPDGRFPCRTLLTP